MCFQILYFLKKVYLAIKKGNQHKDSCQWYNKQIKLIPWKSCFSVLIKHHERNNTSVKFPQNDLDRDHFVLVKYQCQITFKFSMNAILMFYTWFDIYTAWNWWYLPPRPIFINCHLFSHIINMQTMICTQYIPQWNWFLMVTFSDVFIFTSSFFASVIFSSKDNIFVNVKIIPLFWKCNIIKCLISVCFILKCKHQVCF